MFKQLIRFLNKVVLFSGVLVLLTAPALAATTVYLHDTVSQLGTTSKAGAGINCANGSHNYTFRVANTTVGTVTTPTNYSFIPGNNTDPCLLQTSTANGDFTRFATPPLQSGVTISGAFTLQIGCGQSHNNLNSGRSVNIYRWTPQKGITQAVHSWTPVTNDTNSTPECTGATPTHQTVNITPTSSVTFNAGDRIIIDLLLTNSAGQTMGVASRTALTCWGGTVASNCRTYVLFNETFTFAAEVKLQSPQVRAD